MPRDDFHKNAFDEGTVLKLDILSKYLEEWLPVFMQGRYANRINIFDFQCGPGRDVKKVEGSPLRIVRAIARAKPSTEGRVVPVDVYFNDADKQKIGLLQGELDSFELNAKCNYHFSALNFEDCFAEVLPHMQQQGAANFLFIDPTGLVRIAWMIDQLSMLSYTDFIMFVPSANLYRFNKVEEFQKYFPGLTFTGTLIDASRDICTYIQSKLHEAKQEYYLAQFAIKKERTTNVNSLIFGSRSLFGLNKFLSVAWGTSPNGEANFDLCGDVLCAMQYALPFLDKIPRKVESFHETVREMILAKRLQTNHDVVVFALVNGFLPAQARAALKSMKEAGQLQRVPPMSYGSVIKNKKVEILS